MNPVRKIFVVIHFFFLLSYLSAQQPDTSCVNAGIFCDRESIEQVWTLPEPFEPDLPDRICDATDGQPNNILYFGFVPNASTVTFQVNPISCTPTNNNSLGFQWGILEGCHLEDPTYVICNGDQQTSMVTITYDQFQPGTTYYLYLDGYEGAICDLSIDVITGIAPAGLGFTADEPTHFTTSLGDLILPGDTLDFCYNGAFTTTVHGAENNNGFIWSIRDKAGLDHVLSSTADSLDFTFSEKDSLYQICVFATTDCDDSEQICFYIDVIPEPNDSLGIFEYCSADLAEGVDPSGWDGNVLFNPGTYFHTVIDTITACTHLQSITIKGNFASIRTEDTLLCGLDTLFYNGDTITGDTYSAQYRFDGASQNGCDSILNFSMQRVRFYASLSDLSCLDNDQFGLSVMIDSIIPSNYDALVVDWFKDGVHYQTGMMNDLELIVDTKGNYSAMVSVFVAGKSCSFDMEEVVIDRFITAGFSTSTDSICETGSVTVTLDAFNIAAIYTWQSADHVVQVFPGVYEISWDNPGTYNLGLKVDYQNCEVLSGLHTIFVEPELEVPQISCAGATNDSLAISWSPVDCASFYEIRLDGVLQTTTDDLKFSFSGLAEATDYNIEITALSECLCPSVSATIVCSTEDCPDDIILSIPELPISMCFDDWVGDTLITGQINGTQGGTLSWTGNIVEPDGSILYSNLSPGTHPVTLNYQYNNCPYSITDTITLFEPVQMDITAFDISCFYLTDGAAYIDPIVGTDPFELYVNDIRQNSYALIDLDSGFYEVTLIDVNGCQVMGQFDIYRPLRPEIEINGMTIIERGEIYDYELSVDNIEYDSVVWYIPALDTILCSGACDVVSYAPLFDHDLCLEVFYDGECSFDTCIQLKVTQEVHVNIPNIFTPGNRDGLNDFFMVKTNAFDGVTLLNFSIFDRWGELIYHTANTVISGKTDDSMGWDGTFQGKDAMPGVYIYIVEIEDREGNISRYLGDVTLFR